MPPAASPHAGGRPPFGLTGAAALLVRLLVLLVSVAVVGRWGYCDAKPRGSEWAWQWGVGVSLPFLTGRVPGLLAVIGYLLVRADRPVAAGG